MKKITSIDLFAGVGGMRISLQRALNRLHLKDECKLYSEINSYSRQTYDLNFPQTPLIENIKSVKKNEISSKIPDHDILLAGFPCQPFSRAGISIIFDFFIFISSLLFFHNNLFVFVFCLLIVHQLNFHTLSDHIIFVLD